MKKVGKDPFLTQVVKMVDDAQGSKAPILKLADQVSGICVPVVVVTAFIKIKYKNIEISQIKAAIAKLEQEGKQQCLC